MTSAPNTRCHDCGVSPNNLHKPGCDVERCPLCGEQLISCDCIYKELGHEFGFEYKPVLYIKSGQSIPDGYILESVVGNNISVYTYPNDGLPDNIYYHGPTDKMKKRFSEILEESGGRLPWTGEWPGYADCRRFGFYCYPGVSGYMPCDKSHPDAKEDLNRLYKECIWDREKRKYVLKK